MNPSPTNTMQARPLGNTALGVTPIGLGTVKIGRATGVKYPQRFDLPSERQATDLLNRALDLGINLIDTAPAYGQSEARIGRALAHRRHEFVLASKVGETFAHGQSTYDFSAQAIRASVERSLDRLQTNALDILLLHSDGRDEHLLHHTVAVPTLLELRDRGLARAIGLSGKTEAGFRAALDWANVLMIEYSRSAPQLANLVTDAHERGIGTMIKKGLGSGHLNADEAVQFVLGHPGVDTLITGGLSLEHLQANIQTAERTRTGGA